MKYGNKAWQELAEKKEKIVLEKDLSDRQYDSKYQTDTRFFLEEIAGNMMLKQVAGQLDVTYASLHYAMKVNNFSYALYTKILENFDLTEDQKEKLKSLRKKSK